MLFGPESTRHMFRGLHIKPADVDRSLGRTPVAPLLGPLGSEPPSCRRSSCEKRVSIGARALRFSPFDLDVLFVALAPKLTRATSGSMRSSRTTSPARRPTVDLALNLLCGTSPRSWSDWGGCRRKRR